MSHENHSETSKVYNKTKGKKVMFIEAKTVQPSLVRKSNILTDSSYENVTMATY